ncbi:hypothetical protein [Limnohabitans sp. T6-5]|nr:hypothetical protein [Limnohabitans sp. T6-5]
MRNFWTVLCLGKLAEQGTFLMSLFGAWYMGAALSIFDAQVSNGFEL